MINYILKNQNLKMYNLNPLLICINNVHLHFNGTEHI